MRSDYVTIKPVGVAPGWSIRLDGPELEALTAAYGGRVESEDWARIVRSAADVLRRCPPPDGGPSSVTGLALGKVQSGKTLGYTVLAALALDNGYRIIVVLAGTKNPLLEQTFQRLSRDLRTYRTELPAFQNPRPTEVSAIESVIRQGSNALLIALKTPEHIDHLKQVLQSPWLKSQPTLIIDDEGDHASLNTQFRRGRRSATYNAIVELRKILTKHAYVAYTATPQANLLISRIDLLSPDFGVLLEPGADYCGGSTFFGEESERFLRPIHDAEIDVEEGIPNSLCRAIAVFLVGAAIRHLRNPDERHSMLIHTSSRREEHKVLHRSVMRLLELWQEKLSVSPNDPAARELDELMRAAYDDLCQTVRGAPSWETVRQVLSLEVYAEVWMVNSLPQGRDPITTPFRLRNNILIGGNMLERGVTIEGLAVTYITRRAKKETNADTLEQRARWFGYKRPYLDLCRIFLTPELLRDYKELLAHEDDFWEALRRNDRQGLAIREWPRMFRLDHSLGLNPTRSSVANYRRFKGCGWDIQSRLVLDPARAAKNVGIVEKFVERRTRHEKKFGNVVHEILADCPTDEVVVKLLSQLDLKDTDWEASYINEFLIRLYLSHRLPALDVLYMNRGTPRIRTIDSRGRVNPMQGESPHRTPEDPEYYPGDDAIHENRVQLQIHIIKPRGEGVPDGLVTTALALYVPGDNQRYNLQFVVGTDDAR